MSSIVSQLYKLIALATPPESGSQEEARSAAMKACALIRDEHLSVYDPKELVRDLSDSEPDDDRAATFARAVAEHPLRRAMKQREAERAERMHKEREAARFRVG